MGVENGRKLALGNFTGNLVGFASPGSSSGRNKEQKHA
jgi:hypothetical protein